MIPSTLAGTCSTITSGLVISKTTLTNCYPQKAHYASRQPLRNYPCDQERVSTEHGHTTRVGATSALETPQLPTTRP